jgi:DNA-binding NarL/FixJ family response regulator
MTELKLPEKSIKILIVDDHALIRRGIMSILEHHDPTWELHEAEDGVKAILKAQEVNPDIILLDYHLPRLNGGKAATIIKKASPQAHIIMVSMDLSPEMVIEMIQAGVSGIVSKQSPENELLQAIDNVQNGKHHISQQVKDIVDEDLMEKKISTRHSRHTRHVILTDRETEILLYIVKGLSCTEIAEELAISSRTVSNHKANMFRKCKVKSTAELTRFALKSRIVSIEQVHLVAQSK